MAETEAGRQAATGADLTEPAQESGSSPELWVSNVEAGAARALADAGGRCESLTPPVFSPNA